MRRWLARVGIPFAVLACGAAVGVSRGAESVVTTNDHDAAARRLHARAIVVDSHVDAPYTLEKKWADVGERGATPHFDIPRALEGGLTAPFFAIYVPARFAESGGAAREALDLIDLVQRVVQAHPKDLTAAG